MSESQKLRLIARWARIMHFFTFASVLFVGFAMGAYAQDMQVVEGMKVASEMKDASLGQWAVILCGLCVSAMTYMANLMVKWHSQLLTEGMQIGALLHSVQTLVGALAKRPCLCTENISSDIK